MKDIKLDFNSSATGVINLQEQVEGKYLNMQKCMVNIATQVESDPLYPDRGTTLLSSAITGGAISVTAAQHLGNYAAIDTLFFVSANGYASENNSADRITGISVTLQDISIPSGYVAYTASFVFNDLTKTSESTLITSI